MDKQQMLEKAKEAAEQILLPAAKQYAGVLVKDIALEAIKEVVADSSNPYDDMLLAALIPVIEAKMEELLK